MIEDQLLPQFLTASMKCWLNQYSNENFESITEIGLFNWILKPNKRNPKKPKKFPIIGDSIKLKSSIYYKSLYFLELDSKTIHVYISSGFGLSGHIVVNQYDWNGKEYIKQSKILYTIIR
jgi:hypothetical protein